MKRTTDVDGVKRGGGGFLPGTAKEIFLAP